MNKLRHINLVLLVAGHLLLFVYPTAEKSLHVHKMPASVSCCCHHESGPTVETPAPDCPICNFELSGFLGEAPFSPSVCPFEFPIFCAFLPEYVLAERKRSFSLRAPPVV